MLDFTDFETTIKLISTSIESQDRIKRKKVIDDLSAELSKCDDSSKFLTLFRSVRHLIWHCINDQSEIVRDSVLNFLQSVFENKDFSEEFLNELMPVLLHRLQEQEPSEEIRLKLVKLLKIILEKNDVKVYCLEIIQSLVIGLEDKYPAVRQECAECCVRLTGNALYENSVKLVKPLISCMKHKHSKTRILAVQALGVVLKESNWKNIDVQFVFGSLGETLFDAHQGVRMAVTELLGLWLIDLRDRYSFFSRMIPLILSCIVDEQPEVGQRAWDAWSAAGCQYLTENESDLKDKFDFLDEKPDHYPDGVERPNLGCRVLVQRHLVQITTPLIKELTDWQSAVCVKASALFPLLVLHAEEELTQHTETMLLAMYNIADRRFSETSKIRDNVEKAAEYVGCFIKPSMWHLLIFPLLETEPTSGKFFILAALLRGTAHRLIEPHAEKLSKLLAQRDVCTTMHADMQLEVLKSCRALLNNAVELQESSVQNLVYCLVYITSTTAYDSEKSLLSAVGFDCLNLLAEKSQPQNNLIQKYTPLLFNAVRQNINAWTTTHPDFRLFVFLLSKIDIAQDENEIMGILKEALNKETNSEVKSRIFATLANISDEIQRSPTFLINTVHELIIPALVWRAGLTAERLRTVVLACLLSLTPHIKDRLRYTELLPVLFNCVRDEPRTNRKLAQDGIGFIITETAKRKLLTPQLINDIFPRVAERLDDIDDAVRTSSVQNLKNLFTNLPNEMQEKNQQAIFIYFVKTILPYLDDDNESFRNSIYDVLQIIGDRSPKALQNTLKPNVHLYKSQELCNRLLVSLPSGSK